MGRKKQRITINLRALKHKDPDYQAPTEETFPTDFSRQKVALEKAGKLLRQR